MSTAGPNSPGTVVNDSSAGTVAWSNPSNATSSNNSFAEALGMFSGQSSQYLKATNFGFSIPSGATINGITVEVEEKSKFGLTDIEDFGVRIVKGGTIGSTDKGRGAVNWPTGAKTYITYGSSSELWGESWTYSDINSSNFGFAIRAIYGGGKSGTPQVDHIRITVTYTAGGNTYSDTGSGGAVGGGVGVVCRITTKVGSGGAVVGGIIQKHEGGGGGPSVESCSARGSGTEAGKLAQIQISATADDGYWTYAYFFSNTITKFGSTTPVV